MKRNIIVLLIIMCAGVLLAQEPVRLEQLSPSPYTITKLCGDLQNKNLDEVSGMASSIANPGVLWFLNDSGDKTYLYAADSTGKDLGRFTVDGVKNKDWEDLASFELDGTAYLLIGDIGDNNAKRKSRKIYIVKEPDLNSKHRYFIPIYTEIKYKYVDGPRDCESVAVDVKNKKILLLSKRTVPPVLYELNLDVKSRYLEQQAKRVTEVPTVPLLTFDEIKLDSRFGPFGSQPTAMDISSDGKWIVVLTYQNAYLYAFDTDWPTTFKALPQHIVIPRLEQAESVCFKFKSTDIYVSSEDRPAPLYVFKRQK